MNPVLIAGALSAAVLLLARKKSSGPLTGIPALFWGHKTGAGFALVGWTDNVNVNPNGHIQLSTPTLIAPGFINPAAGEPQSPGYALCSTLYAYQGNSTRRNDAAGGYLILRPLIKAGFLKSEAVKAIMFDASSVDKLIKGWGKGDKNVLIPRTVPYFRSRLYYSRDLVNPFQAYQYPVLLELLSSVWI